MKLKCVGGLCDGEMHEIDDNYRRGDQVRVSRTIEFNLPTFEEDLKAFIENKTPDYMSNSFEYYKLEEFHFSEINKTDKIKFLIPLHWKIKDAVLHLLK